MVFDGFRSMFKGKSRDAFDPRGMESFSPDGALSLIGFI